MEDYKKLIEQYRAVRDNSTHRDLAKLERRIWDAAISSLPKTDGALRSKREWLAKELNESPHLMEVHSSLLSYGDVADPIWARVQENGLPLRTGNRLLRSAKDKARHTGISIESALQVILKEFEDLPISRLPDGSITHKRNPGMLPRTQTLSAEEPEEEEEVVEEPQGDPKTFWATLRSMISGYFHTRLDGLDQGAVEKVWREMDVELKVVLEHFQHKIDRMRRDGVAQKMGVNRSKILQACNVLNLDPPPPSKPVDDAFKKRAKNQFRKLAAVYHPDKSRTEETRPHYESVVEAYRILEDL